MKKIKHVSIRTKSRGRRKIAVVTLTDVRGIKHVREMSFARAYYWRNLEKSRKWHVDYSKVHGHARNKRETMRAYYNANREEIVRRRKERYHADVEESRREARLRSAKWRAAR